MTDEQKQCLADAQASVTQAHQSLAAVGPHASHALRLQVLKFEGALLQLDFELDEFRRRLHKAKV